jgi:hypothetical protein
MNKELMEQMKQRRGKINPDSNSGSKDSDNGWSPEADKADKPANEGLNQTRLVN